MLDSLARLLKKDWLWLALTLLAIYVLLPQLKSFHRAAHLLAHPDLPWLALALIASLATFLMAALTYLCLSRRRLKYSEVLLVQLTSNLINRLVPAGIGGLSTNYRYLRHRGSSFAEAATVTATNNSLGAVGHVLLLVLTFSLSSGSFRVVALPSWWPLLLLALPLLTIVLVLAKDHLKIYRRAFLSQLAFYVRHKKRSFLALTSQMLLTSLNVLALYLSARSVGVELSLPASLIVFSAGAGARNLTPTPGGLGGFEAGLVGGFLLFKVSSGPALAATLWFRLLSYWLPLVLGLPAFLLSRHRQLFSD